MHVYESHSSSSSSKSIFENIGEGWERKDRKREMYDVVIPLTPFDRVTPADVRVWKNLRHPSDPD